ncbi:MAG TPA: response regulator [Kofleriaceae bacterium]
MDDDEVITRTLARLLSSLGYVVLGAARTGADALRLVREHRPGLLLVDVNLDGESGIDIAKRVLEIADVPVVFLTGTDHVDVNALAGCEAAFGFVTKASVLTSLEVTMELTRIQHVTRVRLRSLERHYHALFDQMAVGVVEIEADTGRIIELNQRCAQLFGGEIAALVGTDLTERVEPSTRASLRAALAKLGRTTGDNAYSTEIRCRRLGGEEIWIRLSASPFPTEYRHHVVIVEDITAAEHALLESREAEENARTAVRENRAKTDFLAHMSHELRTPLNAVLGLSEALLERVFGALNEEQANTLATIHSSGRHLLELINDVLDIARVEAGKLAIEPEQVDVTTLVTESSALVRTQFATKGQRVVIDTPAALPPISVDRRRIKQVLLNLLNNAGKFSQVGATVTVHAGVAADDRVTISVSDNGPGIESANLRRIFEPFVTLDPSLSRAHDGAGLGLGLAKRIVELHDGTLEVKSEVGVGSTFTITLPSAQGYLGISAVPTLFTGAHGSSGTSTDRPTLLLAEDNEPTVLAVRAYLESRGYAVRVVHDGVAALAAAASPDISALVVDVRLPSLDGLQITRKLRARSDWEHRPIIAMTAHAMPGDEQRCLDAGASAYMAKPVRLRELANTIERLLEGVAS